MTELINGRTPEEIKAKAVTCTMLTCSECPYEKDEYVCDANDVMDNLLAYVKHLEAKVPKWISVEERSPEYKTAVLGYGLRYRKYPDTDPFPDVHVVYFRGEDEGWFTFWNNEYVAVNHWMPLPEPLEER